MLEVDGVLVGPDEHSTLIWRAGVEMGGWGSDDVGSLHARLESGRGGGHGVDDFAVSGGGGGVGWVLVVVMW